MTILTFAILGVLVGLIGSLLGIGGGVIIVPLLTFVFDFSPQEAIGTSMFVVLLNSLSGAYGYWRQKRICTNAAWRFSLATIPGAFLGSYVSEYLTGKAFYIFFGIFFFCFALNMFWKSTTINKNDNLNNVMPKTYNWQLGSAASILIGFLSSILGIGGGVMHVPMMTYALKFPIKTAIATSTAILAVSSISGTISHGLLHHIVWTTAICIGLGACLGASFGVRISAKTKSSLLMKATALIVLTTSIKFLINGFF